MFFPFVLFAISLIVYIQNHQMMTADIELPEDIRDWCPFTSFCQPETGNHSPGVMPPSRDGFKPCCEPCSCASNCGLKRQCCRYEYDIHKIDQRLGTICKSLTIREHELRVDDYYYIVDKCPNKENVCSSMNTSTLGGFSPVYSRSSGLIYFNMECASCHNQTDLVDLIPVITVKFLTGAYSNIISNGINSLGEDAYLQFKIPKHIDISGELCYPFMIRDCLKIERNYYHLKHLCTSYNATFHMGILSYQNVYCYLCGRYNLPSKGKWIEGHSMCPISKPKKGSTNPPLTVLLDNNWAMSEPAEKKYACLEIENTALQSCRPIHCPEGRFRVGDTCSLYGKSWYVEEARVLVNLTLANQNDRLLVSDLLQIPNEKLRSPRKEWIRRGKLQDWKMELFYRENGNDSSVRFMVAVLFTETQTVQPKLLLDRIRKSLRTKWIININGTGIELRAKFNKYSKYFSSRANENGDLAHWVPEWEGEDISVADRITKLAKVEVTLFRPGNILFITKLFFCELIDMKHDEFTVLDDNVGAVFLVNQKKRLGSGEFVVSAPGKTFSYPYEIRVCLSDVFDGSSSMNGTRIMMAFMLVCLVLINIFIM